MAIKTFAALRSQITTTLADNTNGAITASVVRAAFNALIDKIEAGFTPIVTTNLTTTNTYQNDNLINLSKSQLVVLLNGTAISSTPTWENDANAFIPATGTINLPGTLSGRLQIVILPKDNI